MPFIVCKKCKQTKAHKAHQLCVRCYDNEYSKRPIEIARKKKYNEKYFTKLRKDPKYLASRREYTNRPEVIIRRRINSLNEKIRVINKKIKEIVEG